MSLAWEANGKHAIRSKCHSYVITENFVPARLFAARLKGRPFAEPLGNHATAADAKAACVAMAMGYPRAKA